MTIDTFDIAAGWSQTDDILLNSIIYAENGSRSEAIATAGFCIFHRLGAKEGPSIETYERSSDFLVIAHPVNGCLMYIFCPGLGSYLALLGQLEPWFRISRAAEQDRKLRAEENQ